MSNEEQIKQIQNPMSKLESFSLGFEYDKTLNEIKHEVRRRAI